MSSRGRTLSDGTYASGTTRRSQRAPPSPDRKLLDDDASDEDYELRLLQNYNKKPVSPTASSSAPPKLQKSSLSSPLKSWSSFFRPGLPTTTVTVVALTISCLALVAGTWVVFFANHGAVWLDVQKWVRGKAHTPAAEIVAAAVAEELQPFVNLKHDWTFVELGCGGGHMLGPMSKAR